MSGLGNILIVDDNAKLLADALPMYGYEVRVAENGKDAIKTLAKSDIQFDIILLDVVMPIMDGWETLKLIRSQEKYNKIPIIMLTSVDEVQKQISGFYGNRQRQQSQSQPPLHPHRAGRPPDRTQRNRLLSQYGALSGLRQLVFLLSSAG